MYSLASRIEYCPWWNIEAARTASASPWTAPSTRCSRFPTPPLAMTGTLTALLTFRVSSRSKPSLVPSLSIEVKSISPAPRPTASCAHSTTSRPVDFRPPLTYASQHGGSEDTCLASMATTMHCEPKRRAGRQDGRISQGRRVQGDLVRPGVQHCAHALLVSYSSPDSEGNEYLLRATISQPHDGLSLLVRGRNIQEYNFICTFTIIESSKLNGISGIPNVHKIRTLYYAALVHVQARDDSFQEHVNASRASFTVKRPSYSDLPTITPVTPTESNSPSVRRSASVVTPPDTIIPMSVSSASSRIERRLIPSIIPSLEISV